MLLSRGNEEGMKTIDFIKSLELPTGGIAAWQGQKAYPECSGYLIPTLLNYGETELAKRIGDWLLTIQHSDGSFDGLDGIPRPFDTAACMEGLIALGYTEAAEKAKAWLETMLHNDRLRIHPGTLDTHIYNLRALALMGVKLDAIPKLYPTRTHYTAYALEGLYNMGLDIADELKNNYSGSKCLLPFDDRGSDTCATAQMAVLCLKNGIECNGLIEAVREMVDSDGGVLHGSGDRRKCAWTAKYYLDMEYCVRQKILSDAPIRERPEAPTDVRPGNKKAKRKVS